MAKNCNTSPFYLQGQSPTIQNQVAIIERFLKKQLPNYAVITISLNGVDVPKDEFGNVNLEIERINYTAGDGISIDDNVISTTVIDDSTQSNKSTWSSNKINSLIQELNNFTITVVNQLPVSGEPYVLYLVGNGSEEQSNVKDEYLWIVENNVGRWEKIGTTQITILQSDWNQSDSTAQDYIKNKPTDLVRTSDIEGLLKNDGTVYTGKYLEQVTDLDNFQASEGKIVQYIGATNAKYTNSFNYRKVGKQTVIPSGTEYIEINDQTNEFIKVGIENGRYYKVNDYEEIYWDVAYIDANYQFGIPIRRNDSYRVSTEIGIHVYIYDKIKRITNIQRLDANGYLINYYTKGTGRNSIIEFDDNTQVELDTYDQGSGTPIGSHVLSIYENINGVRIYKHDGYSGFMFAEYWGDEKRASYIGRFTKHNTEEETIIDTTEWQQCVPPEEDTSHYVLDSDIGWIEH